MTTETNYRSAATQLLEQARAELAQGDTRQASEKGWGAAAQAVKAAAEARGWERRTHVALFRAVSRLAEETENDDLDRLFGTANSLHGNFYENWLTANMVRLFVDDVVSMVKRLEADSQSEV